MISLLIFLIILAALFWVLDIIPVPGWLKQAGQIILGVIAIIYLITFLFGMAGAPHWDWPSWR